MSAAKLTSAVIQELADICPSGVHQDVPLAQFSRWRIGGLADLVVEPRSVSQLCAIRAVLAREGLASVVIGDTSNLLFADDGLRAIMLRIAARMSRLRVEGSEVTAEAGLWVPHLARCLQRAGLTGAEHVCGIPGTLGGLICMNGGSQRRGIGSAVVNVTAVTPWGGATMLDQADCGFAYRTSVFQSNGFVIAVAQLRFAQAPDRSAIRRQMLAILRERRRKFPRKQPNCGSVFKSNPAMYAAIGPPGAAIERLGFKGYRIGDAMVSPRHGNFFVNAGKARSPDMLRLIQDVGDMVFETTGHRMESEVRYVTPAGVIRSAYTPGA